MGFRPYTHVFRYSASFPQLIDTHNNDVTAEQLELKKQERIRLQKLLKRLQQALAEQVAKQSDHMEAQQRLAAASDECDRRDVRISNQVRSTLACIYVVMLT
jgi:hypothetical protein